MRLILALIMCLLPSFVLAAEAKAVFAGGCFWSMQKAFDGMPGITDVVAGFSGGASPEPTYEQVVTGKTGYLESVQVTYDPAKITYDRLLNIYWHHIDPVDPNGQFCDKGPQYRTAIFYGSPEEKQKAADSKMLMEADDTRLDGKPVTTQIRPKMPFYAAEDYHQRYYRKNPLRYNFYRGRCGQDQRLQQIWGH